MKSFRLLVLCFSGVNQCIALNNDFVMRAYNNYTHKEGTRPLGDYGNHYSHHLHSLLKLTKVKMLEIGWSRERGL